MAAAADYELDSFVFASILKNGATRLHRPHLEFMGVVLQEPRIDAEGLVHSPIGHGLDRADVERQMLHGLEDRSRASTKRIEDHLHVHARMDGPGSVKTGFDAVSLALLDTAGISPAWLLLLSALLHDGILKPRPGSERRNMAFSQVDIDDEPIMEMRIHLMDGVVWNGEGFMVMPAVPETVALAAPGQPISRFVSHPIVDGFGLTVREVRTRPDGGACVFDAGHVPYKSLFGRDPEG